jgi:hypothetical protein
VAIAQTDGDTRPLSANPSRATRILISVGIVCAAAALLALAANSGATLDDPIGYRVYEIAITAVAVGLLAVGAWQSVQLGRLSRLLLMSVAAGTAFWQETYGDWGAYCLYSARFLTYDWGHTVWSARVRCWWFIAGYTVFYTSFFLGLIAAVRFARNRWPSANPYITAALVSLPAFYVFDLVWEGTTTGLGYWSYTYTFGPAMHVGNGTFPLLWPILEQAPFMALAAFALTWRNSRGEDVFEVTAGFVLRRCPGQIAILTSWIVILNIAFLTTTILPIMALRWIAGPASSAMP